MLSSVFRESSRIVSFLNLLRKNFEFCERTKTGQEKNGGHREAVAKGSRKWDVWTSNWECVCSGVPELLALE